MDSQVVELIGKHRLTAELLRAGLEVAEPVRDRGIDLIAYADLDARLNAFVACPIQMKVSSGRAFSLDAKYERFPNLIIAYIWDEENSPESQTYALTYREALGVATEMGWTTTKSWAAGYYTNTSPGARLMELLSPYRMTPERWWQKVTGQITKAAV